MYTEITALANSTGICTASNNYFAKLYEVKPTTVSEWIRQLTEAGYVESLILVDQGNRRELQIPIPINPMTSSEKAEDPSSEKAEYNNTSKNSSISTDVKMIYGLYLKVFVIPRLKKTYQDNSEALRDAMKVYRLTPKRQATINARLKETTVDNICAAIRGYGSEDWTHVGAGNRPNWEADLTEFICRTIENIEKGAMLFNSGNAGGAEADPWSKM
jgi:DNA-binding PadR family transcriptional regulator